MRGRLGSFAAPESFTQPHKTNFPPVTSIRDDRNPLSLADSRESGGAAVDRDVTSSTIDAAFEASVSDLSSDQGTDPHVDKDLPLAHGQSTDGTHPLTMTASERQFAANHYNSHDDYKAFSGPNSPSRLGVRASLNRHLRSVIEHVGWR